ncbi:arsenical-resistance protein [bacterium (Candidatus Blackallbacteria) CG17_big_fil_post_rev_8_21_14_2_50_48_46]|uniref:Arsenical-resistance protein n=1 Tax=bacterium (Candidatus Blackallbacteria) CG17_big_fil_post_rev_8_21_14_2_50_48_46 TaxID=2014261 RepID=A0A2M7G0K8_9BACT|nr:MAG: arsenical-resistance protein [bacterium (Candidatus Blackallbacteria) CG18_big_fil_WC_8_21_14_2_50_49_26]PIW15254.1 MAG: arsenical-resistance protein [bacterium (Candidatus Blackallbacteria) CG17_big_fil_post_rev_8_21_14_2_50_48_46]PIW45237.1 MAG: arsenical-resistance protein [bacterium (Candidatus Blackallbacteria) CG13_big_fil_rev_8_21_14_2_50_49_14]
MSTKDQTVGKLAFFERYLSLWVGLCIVGGIGLGQLLGPSIQVLSKWEIYNVNLPVAVLVWLMIYPMMLKIDFASLKNWSQHGKGLVVTLSVNWLIKPFSMALLAMVFFKHLLSPWISPDLAQAYLAGAILLGAAPCTAMVFVWSYLTEGDANFTLVQVAINDLILLVAFIPIVGFLLGVSNIQIPYGTLFTSVLVFVVIPLVAGWLTHKILWARKGQVWFEQVFLPKLKPVSILALLSTLVLLFAFQGQQILSNPLHIFLIALPLTLQTYLIFFLAWLLGRKLDLPHAICSPAAMIGASNFFELAVAVAIALFGLTSGAALATVVGVLIEVPVMLSLVALSNRWRY